MRQIRIGKIMLTDGGEWKEGKSYPALTYVTHKGDGWWCRKANIVSEPTADNPDWVRATNIGTLAAQMETEISGIRQINEEMSAAEQQRKLDEQARATAEQSRIEKEAKRNEEEAARQAEEAKRIAKEISRDEAESQRTALYEAAEVSRFEQFAEAEKMRENKYAVNEAARNKAELERIQAEGQRVTNEENRQVQFATAMTDTEAAITAAEDIASHPTYVGEDFYVYVWDNTTKAYNRTGIFLKGEGFTVYKVYESIVAMEADAANVTDGRFVLINTGNVEDQDNARLYLKTGGAFVFLVDMSGSVGFTGKTPVLTIGIITAGADRTEAGASLSPDGTDADGNPKFLLNLTLPCLAYADLTPEQIADLQKPAKEMIATLEATNAAVTLAESERVTAEEARVKEENLREAQEAARMTAESGRATAELARAEDENARAAEENARKEAEASRVEAEAHRQTTVSEVVQQAQEANTLATAGAAYAKEQGDYAKEQGDAAVAIINSNVERVESVEASLESLIENFEEQGDVHAQTLDIDALPTICGFPLIKIMYRTPDLTPDFIGQIWIDKTGNAAYIATHCNSAAGYKAI